MMSKLFWGFVILGIGAAANATLLTANFDSQAEGVNGSTLADGGITFSNATWNIGGTSVFVIDDASTPFFPGFSTPNVLAFGGYAPGPGSGAGRIGRFEFSAGVLSTTGALDVWSFGDFSTTNSITLVGYLGGSAVASFTTALVPSVPTPAHYHLSLATGTYDHFALVSSGTTQGGDSFLAVDNVTINTVPEPGAFMVLGLGALALVRRRRS